MSNAYGRAKKQVDAYFAARSVFWKQVYERPDVYSTIHQLRRDLVLDLVDSLSLPPGARALDAGCGAGLLSVALARRGYRVSAIDSVEAMLEQTRDAAVAAGVSGFVSATNADVCSLAFPEPVFRLVLLIGVLPWLESPELALRQAAGALQPGGYLVVNDDNLWRLDRLLDPWVLGRWQAGALLRRCGLLPPPATPHARQSSIHRFKKMLFECGFEPMRVRSFGFGPFTLLHRNLLPDSAGMALHQLLQRLADRRVPLLRATGLQNLALARRR